MISQPILDLLEEISHLPGADRIFIFGSVASFVKSKLESESSEQVEMMVAPVDLDIYLKCLEFENFKDAKSKYEATIDSLLVLSRTYYGYLDPFVLTRNETYVRNANANLWVPSRNARQLRKAMTEASVSLRDAVICINDSQKNSDKNRVSSRP